MPLAIIFLLLVSTGLRFYRLEAQSFWNDEGNSARLSERSLSLIIEGTASDVHPPLYYVLLRGWRELLGDSEFGLRSLSAFAGILTVAATVALARRQTQWGRWFASSRGLFTVTVGALAAINPALVYYSQETRMYALLALIAVLATLVFLRWLAARSRLPWAIAYVALSTAGLYTHYFYPTLFVLQGIILLFLFFRYQATLVFAPQKLRGVVSWQRTALTWLGMVVISFLLYAPWVPIFVRQTGGRDGLQAPLPAFVWNAARWMAFGETIAAGDLVVVSVVLVLLLGWALWRGGRRSLIPVAGVLVPLLAMYAAGTTNPAFYKFMLVAVPFFCLWLALAAWGTPSRARSGNWLSWLPGLVLGAILTMGMFQSLINLYSSDAFARDDYRAMAARIAAEAHPNAGIILNAPNQWEVFTYYHQEGAPVYPLPKGQPDPALLEPELAAIAAQHERLYALFWGDEQRDPQHVVENWLDNNAFKAEERWVGDVRFAVYATTSDMTTASHERPGGRFEDGIELTHITIGAGPFHGGGIVPVTMEWQAYARPQGRYKVFLHLLNSDGEIVAQQDGEPMDGTAPTPSWTPEETTIDLRGIAVPDGVTAGDYELRLGLYKWDDPSARLAMVDGKDALELGTVTIE